MQASPPLLTLTQARALTLDCQGLLGSPSFGRGTQGALRALERLGYVQIDTISVIERAHHHVLWSRVPGYEPSHLERLHSDEKRVFEYWSHAAAYLPISHYRYSLPRMQAYAEGKKKHWHRPSRKLMEEVLARIRREGPLAAKDFANVLQNSRGKRAGKWFDRKPAKIALEQLFMEGKLMTAGRRSFQKIYDLPERFLPSDVDADPPSSEELGRFRVLSALRALGFAREQEITYQRATERRAIQIALPRLLSEGQVVEVRVQGLEGRYFALPGVLDAAQASEVKKSANEPRARVHLLSPFDNLVIQRKRLLDLFGFDYQIECYTPGPKRRFGYFVLPILWGDRLIGRLDPKADRDARVLRVRSLHFEKGFQPKSLGPALAASLQDFARFNGCEEIHFERPLAKFRIEGLWQSNGYLSVSASTSSST